MGQTLENGVYLPSEGERNCYAGLKTNWEILDQKVADVTALQQAVAGALHREIVESLPTTDIDPNTIYMILSGTSATENVYNEFMYVNNAWELIGTSATDLTNYYTKAEVDGKLLLKASASDLTSHTGDTTIHVTTADKNKWNNNTYVFRYSSTALVASSTNSNTLLDNTDNLKVGDKVIDSSGVLFSVTAIDTVNSTFTVGSALIDLALDANVVHTSGNESISGVKTFSDDTFVKSLNNTREVTSPSASSTVMLPIVATVTYTDQSPSQSATLNLKVSADGSKTFYPNENGLYSLGLVSRNWDNVYSYMFESFGKHLGNEYSANARTNLYLKANRDTGGQSGVYISKFRQNKAQGAMGAGDVVVVSFDVLENSVRTNRSWFLRYLNWTNDVPKTVEVRSLCEKVDYRLTHINALEPSALGMPDLSNGVDISSYITTGYTDNNFTPPANGWIWVRLIGNGASIIQGDFGINSSYVTNNLTSEKWVETNLFVTKNVQSIIRCCGVTGIVSAYFYPCLGNV